MEKETENKEKQTFFKKLHKKYRLVIYENDSFLEKKHIQLSRFRFFSLVFFICLIIVGATTSVIFFTSVREMVPGYLDVTLDGRVYHLEKRADSLEKLVHQQDLFILNVKRIITDEEFLNDTIRNRYSDTIDYSLINLQNSLRDSVFRLNFERNNKDISE